MKKLISCGVALAAVTSLVGMSVFAAKNYTSKDLVSLGDALLGRGPVLEGQDVTGDGIVNVFDLIAMRQAMLTTGEFVQSTVPATEENVRYIGRNYYDGETLWLVHSGSAAQFTVSGKSASVTISGGGNENNDEKSRPRYAVIVDGEIILDELIDKAEKTVTLFEGETNRTAKVEVIHLSEANNGAVGLKSVTVDSDALKPVSPTAKKDLTIEFIGDSITCAYGVEGKDQYENFKTSTENIMKSYAYLTAKQLDADYSSVSYSGFGVISGYTSDALNTDSIVPPIYTQIAKSTYTQPWDFESHKSDVVVINLGTNDDTYLSKDFENRCDTYTEGYVDFLKTVRENNPDAYIICTVGTMGCEEVYPLIEKAVAQFTQETGDKKVTSFQSATQNMADGLGSDWHPSAVTHQKAAYFLADFICKTIGRESDEMGVNVTSGLDYQLTEAEGTNGFGFYSDWNNSYHYTVVSGGASPEDISVSMEPFGLKAGAKYSLSFTAEATEGVALPVYVKNGSTVLFEDEYIGKGTGSKVTYTGEFTVKDAVSQASLVFGIGANDGLAFGIESVELTRIG
ncbi:MAG: hypothetical protein IJ170_10780 [Ruminococcus sp.]|nr:hypothetical protein [Ruminococcus sp.]